MDRHPHRRQPAHLVAMLAWFLVLLTGTGCALPVLRPAAVSTATPAYTCTPTQTRDEVLTPGTLPGRSPYSGGLRYGGEATSHPHSERGNLLHCGVRAQPPEPAN